MAFRSLQTNATILFISIISGVASSDFTKEQKHLLEKIKVAAEEAGLPPLEVEAIEKFDPNVCYEEECLHAALEIFNKINLQIEPCDNGKWIEFVCRPQEEGTLNQLVRLNRRVTNQTLELLTSDAFQNSTDFLLPHARKYYRQCVNKGDKDRDDVLFILNVTQKYGAWPMFTHREPSKSFPWMEFVMDANRLAREDYDYTPLFLAVTLPPLGLQIGKTSLPHTHQGISDYKKLLTGMQRVGELKEPVNTTQIEETLKFMTEFNEKVVNLTGSAEEMTLSELQSKTDEYILQKGVPWKVDWKHFFEGVLAGTGIQLNESSPNMTISFQSVMELISLVEAEMRSNETRGRISIVNALNLNVATMLVQESTTLADNLRTFRCAEPSMEREELCLTRIKETFGYSLSKSYLNLYYDDELTQGVIQLMGSIREGFLHQIGSLEWIGNSTKEVLLDKINSTQLYAIQPDWMREPGGLEKFYEGFPTSSFVAPEDSDCYAENFLEVHKWEVAKKRAWFNKMTGLESYQDVDIYEGLGWNAYLAPAGAYYDHCNKIQINSGLLQKPIFSRNISGFMLYGGLGTILAHELGHGMDTSGRKYDKFEKPEGYWDSGSLEQYNKWVDRIANVYHSVPHRITDTMKPLVHPKIANTINEDIADVLGVSATFHAYSKYLEELEEDGGKEKVLPGLTSFSPQKLFFIKWGIMWCDNPDVQTKFKFLEGPHSSGYRRAFLPLLLIEEFRETFACDGNSTENEIDPE